MVRGSKRSSATRAIIAISRSWIWKPWGSAVTSRSPIAARRNWRKKPRRATRSTGIVGGFAGPRGLRLLRLRGERLERPFAHLYETGGMRRVHLRGRTNIRKRVLIHAGGFNLGLLVRQLLGVGTPRGLQGRRTAVLATLLMLIGRCGSSVRVMGRWHDSSHESRRLSITRSRSRTSASRERFHRS